MGATFTRYSEDDLEETVQDMINQLTVQLPLDGIASSLAESDAPIYIRVLIAGTKISNDLLMKLSYDDNTDRYEAALQDGTVIATDYAIYGTMQLALEAVAIALGATAGAPLTIAVGLGVLTVETAQYFLQANNNLVSNFEKMMKELTDTVYNGTPSDDLKNFEESVLDFLDGMAGKPKDAHPLNFGNGHYHYSGAYEAGKSFGKALGILTPIALDLNGDGIHYTSLNNSNVFFDLNGDHFAEHTEWLDGTDGFLVRDLNSNGQIDDITEMFGANGGTTAYQKLTALDTNHNGMIDSGDAAFSSLEIWQDANGNGVVDAGELTTLAQRGITSVSTAATNDTVLGGHAVTGTSTFTYSNSTTGTAADVLLQTDELDTWYIGDGTAASTQVDPSTLSLPQSRGYGTVVTLPLAMTRDAALETLVSNFTNITATGFHNVYAQMEAIITKWTGSDTVDPTSRGPSIDARHLVTLENIDGQPYTQMHVNNPVPDPDPNDGASLLLGYGYSQFEDDILSRLMVQGPLKSVFSSAAYDYASDKLILNDTLSMILERASVNVPVGSAIDVQTYWSEIARVVTSYSGDLGVSAANAKMAVDAAAGFHTNIITVFGSAANDFLEADGGDGGSDGTEDVFFGGAGNDTLEGGNGSDIYLFGRDSGSDVIDESTSAFAEPWDAITFNDGVTSADVTLSRVNSWDLLLSVPSISETILVKDYFVTQYNRIEEIQFSDGVVWGADTIYNLASGTITAPTTTYGTSGNDTFTLTAAQASIVMEGGADTLVVSSATGAYTSIADFNYGQGDKIDITAFNGQITKLADLNIVNRLGHAQITLPSGQIIELTNVDARNIDASWFISGTLTNTGVTLSATSNDDTSLESFAGNDVLTGLYGNDTLSGGAGNDTLIGGPGNDTFVISNSATATTINDFVHGTDQIDLRDLAAATNISNLTIAQSGANTTVTIAHNGTGNGNLVLTLLGVTATSLTSNDFILNASSNLSFEGDAYANLLTGGLGNDTINGSSGDDTIYGDAGNDSLLGSDGNDLIIGGRGSDYIDGGTGNNTISYASSSTWVSVNLSTNSNFNGDASFDNILNIQNVVGSNYNDALTSSSVSGSLSGGMGNDSLTGEAGNDTLDGGIGDDLLFGGAGDDLLIGGVGSDLIDGGTGNNTVSYATSSTWVSVNLGTNSNFNGDASFDNIMNVANVIGSDYNDALTASSVSGSLSGGLGNDSLTGGSGNDSLDGGLGDDLLFGGAGNDLLIGGVGSDLMDGGAGVDTVSYANSSTWVSINLGTNSNFNGDASFDNIINVENVIGSNYNDFLTASSVAGSLSGGLGNDSLTGGSGNDTLIGGAGADTIGGGAGTDTVDYTTSATAVTVNLALSTAQVGGTGDSLGDVITNVENVTGSNNDDMITGSSIANVLSGGLGNDTIIGGAGADTIDGGAGTDTVSYATSAAAVTVSLALATAQTGGTGDSLSDVITNVENVTGSQYADKLTGSSGDNIITGGAGADTIDGGAGADTVGYAASTAAVTVNLSLTTAQVGGTGDSLGDVITNVENVTGSQYADILTGNTGNNVIAGGAGADTIDGGAGTDTVDYTTSATAVTVNLALSTAQVGGTGDSLGDVITNVENVTGSNNDDMITGSSIANVLSGGLGNDTIIGGAGADTIDGGAGTDTVSYATSAAAVTVSLALATAQTGGTGDSLSDVITNVENVTGSQYADKLTGSSGDNIITGGAGADTIDGGAGADTVGYAASTAAVTVNLSLTTAQVGGTGDSLGDVITNVENVIGSNNDDIITGNSVANVLSGGLGNDTIIGGAGADTIDGGAGTDTISYATSAAAVMVDLSLSTLQVGGTGDSLSDVITNVENVTGSNYDDIITGSAIANVLSGGLGNDIITGGAGADTIDGGAGTDTVSYAASTAAVTVNLSLTTAQVGGTGDSLGDVITNVENVTGSQYADILTGNTGNNVIAGGAGADTIDGGAGTDTVDYTTSATAVTVNLALSTAQVGGTGDSLGDVITNVENVTGSNNDDMITGSSIANVLSGGLGNDTIIGGAGADTIDGGAGTDTVSYATSAAAVTVSLALATAQTGGTGDSLSDVITNVENVTGSQYADKLTGSSGDNIITGGAGADTIDGGAGADTVGYAASTAAVTVNLSLTTAQVGGTGDSLGDVITNVENVIGSNNDDIITGNSVANVLSGGLGNDTIIGGAGADTIDGGAGTDTISYATSAAAVMVDLLLYTSQTGGTGDSLGDVITNVENIIGSNYNDIMAGGSTANLLSGGSGNDTLIGGAGADTIDGGTGTDTVDYTSSYAGITINLSLTTAQIGGTGDSLGDVITNVENVTGSNNDDIITGSSVANLLSGGLGNDIITGGAGADTIDGGAGTDTVTYVTSTAAVTVNLSLSTAQVGGTGDSLGDVITNVENVTGSLYADKLTGSSGDNIILGGAGADTIDGGAGTDTVSYATSAAAVTVNLTLSTAQTGGTGDSLGDIITNVENVTGSNYNDMISGTSTSNVLIGGLGNDTIIGGAGADTIDGGADNDTLSYATSVAAVMVDLSLSTAQVGGSGDSLGDVIIDVENIIGSNYNDVIFGSSIANVLSGGLGNDTIIGGTGADTIDGGAGLDTVDYSASVAAITVNLSLSTAQTSGTGDSLGDVITNVENVTGSNNDDVIIGNSTANVLNGGYGNDTITGGLGADTIDGGVGIDTVSYANSAAAVMVNLSLSSAQTGGTGDSLGDIVTNVENVTGSQYADLLTGTSGNNIFVGNGGSDSLTGNGGYDNYKLSSNDTMTTIVNGLSTNTGASGELDASVSHDHLWFVQSGNDLKVEVLGTTQQAIIKNWYVSGNKWQQLSEIVGSDSMKIDSSLQSLVTAMASFGTANPSFNATTTTHTSLTDSYFAGTLASTYATSWHA